MKNTCNVLQLHSPTQKPKAPQGQWATQMWLVTTRMWIFNFTALSLKRLPSLLLGRICIRFTSECLSSMLWRHVCISLAAEVSPKSPCVSWGLRAQGADYESRHHHHAKEVYWLFTCYTARVTLEKVPLYKEKHDAAHRDKTSLRPSLKQFREKRLKPICHEIDDRLT